MKKILLLFIAIISVCSMKAQTGSWRAYMSYQDVQQIVKVNHQLFVRASNGLYSYNLNDQSIETYDKIKNLSDTHINMIAWNPEAKQLIIVYDNSNVDLMDADGNAFNIGSLYLKSMTQNKTINSIFIHGPYAWLATRFGIVRVNMSRKEIAESTILNDNITNIDIVNNRIYARNADGTVFTALLSQNLINPSNWTATTDLPASLFQEDKSDWNQYYDLVKTLKPGGPKYNHFYFMRFKHDRLYTVGGAYNCVQDAGRPGIIQILNDDEWTILGNDVIEKTEHGFFDMDVIDCDPNDPNHLFIGGKSGLYEFRDNAFFAEYTIDNSPLTSTLGNTHNNAKNYTIINGLSFDLNGNLWCLNSGTLNYSILQLNKDREWNGYAPKELVNGVKGLKGLRSLIYDSRGYFWFVNYHWEKPCVVCFDPQSGKNIHMITVFNNQDGEQIAQTVTPQCIVEDLNHDLWIGTDKGPLLFNKDNITMTDPYFTQVKVPRNDGTDYADYLMSGIPISCIAIDGANRKWFGTQNDGVYLISADNMEQLQHFTTENSPLLSNTIQSLAINHKTGEVFIGTEAGLCSYMSNATAAVASMDDDEFFAFPNPVPSNYNGLITIRGFSMDADVKVVSVSGKLVAQGRSNGGTFTWDCRDRSGRRVATGVYMVIAATSSGEKGAVCKIAVIN